MRMSRVQLLSPAPSYRWSTHAQMAELVDALGSGPSGSNPLEVRVLFWAPDLENPFARRGFVLCDAAFSNAIAPRQGAVFLCARVRLERVHSLRSRTPKKAKATICRLVLNLRSQFFQSRLFFSNQEKLRSTTHRFGNTAKRCNSFRLAISTSAPINSCTDEANALPV